MSKMTIQEAVRILDSVLIVNYKEKEALEMAKQALLTLERERWRPVMDGDGEMPLVDDEGYSGFVLANFTNAPGMFDIAQYREDDQGGAFYSGDEPDPYTKIGLFVSAWRPLPERYQGD